MFLVKETSDDWPLKGVEIQSEATPYAGNT